ncbi:hypothetical protein HHI36_006274, partial [Cryptolaemus montrouzieri]
MIEPADKQQINYTYSKHRTPWIVDEPKIDKEISIYQKDVTEHVIDQLKENN